MKSKKRGYKKATSPSIPSFDQLSQTAEKLKQEGKLPTLAQLLEAREKIQQWYREDHEAKQRGSSEATAAFEQDGHDAATEAKPAKRKRGK
jgi:hypothetical protein